MIDFRESKKNQFILFFEGLYKKNRFRTAQLFHDNAGSTVANTVLQHFNSMRSVGSRRTPTIRQKSRDFTCLVFFLFFFISLNLFKDIPGGSIVPISAFEKHRLMLQNAQIQYATWMSPLEIAVKREQIREKQKQVWEEINKP